MRYERIELNISTGAMARLRDMMLAGRLGAWGFAHNAVVNAEMFNLYNELEARLQRRDVDPQAVQQETPVDNGDLIGA